MWPLRPHYLVTLARRVAPLTHKKEAHALPRTPNAAQTAARAFLSTAMENDSIFFPRAVFVCILQLLCLCAA